MKMDRGPSGRPLLLLPILPAVVALLLSTLSPSSAAFTPPDRYLLDCGSSSNVTALSRTFVPDSPKASSWTLTSAQSTTAATTTDRVSSFPTGALLRTARIFSSASSYAFPISHPGRHFLRLHFLPFVTDTMNLTQAVFSVSTQTFTLLSDFHPSNSSTPILKEYLIPTTSVTSLVLSFSPAASSFAFVNAIELVSVPDALFPDDANSVNPASGYSGLNATTFETAYRVNMGGAALAPGNDTLDRYWVTDPPFQLQPNLSKAVSYGQQVKYETGGQLTEETAPQEVYSTAVEMAGVDGSAHNFNVTWEFKVDPSYPYLVRFHFCDIVSNRTNALLFYVYLADYNLWPGGLDLSTQTLNTLAQPYYADYVLAVPNESGKLRVSIGPSGSSRVVPNAILNGLEVMKLNNSLGSLGGLGLPAAPQSSSNGSVSAMVIAIAATSSGVAVVAVGVIVCLLLRRRKRGKVVAKQSSKQWRPLPALGSSTVNATVFSNGTASSVAQRNPSLGNHVFPLAAMMEATDGFDEGRVIGVGGFGKVYRGVLRDGTPVAIKRGNRMSQQGLREFRTEIEMLSQLRHRHLVSLIGFCNEDSEMILVYEYMERGTLRSHLYGEVEEEDAPRLSWRQRLEICIGAARGLHYLHTGQPKPIIHRDVKSANILLDGDLRAKVADFGLSKTGPEMDKTHVSTAVKGSFGYLDPEYFRRQQLTEKSDVYSFGVVLLEVLCARPVIDPSLPRGKVNLAEWGMKLRRKGRLVERAADPMVRETARAESLEKFAETVEKCLAEYGAMRPAMGDVLWNLEYALQLQVPRREAEEEDGGDVESFCDDAADHVRDSSPLVRNLRSSELEGSLAVGEGIGEEDLPPLSMSRVFAQLVKSENRH